MECAFGKDYSNCTGEDVLGGVEGSDQGWRQMKGLVDFCGNVGKKGWGVELKI